MRSRSKKNTSGGVSDVKETATSTKRREEQRFSKLEKRLNVLENSLQTFLDNAEKKQKVAKEEPKKKILKIRVFTDGLFHWPANGDEKELLSEPHKALVRNTEVYFFAFRQCYILCYIR